MTNISRGICDLCQDENYRASYVQYVEAHGVEFPLPATCETDHKLAKLGNEHRPIYIMEHGKFVALVGYEDYPTYICAACLRKLADEISEVEGGMSKDYVIFEATVDTSRNPEDTLSLDIENDPQKRNLLYHEVGWNVVVIEGKPPMFVTPNEGAKISIILRVEE